MKMFVMRSTTNYILFFILIALLFNTYNVHKEILTTSISHIELVKSFPTKEKDYISIGDALESYKYVTLPKWKYINGKKNVDVVEFFSHIDMTDYVYNLTKDDCYMIFNSYINSKEKNDIYLPEIGYITTIKNSKDEKNFEEFFSVMKKNNIKFIYELNMQFLISKNKKNITYGYSMISTKNEENKIGNLYFHQLLNDEFPEVLKYKIINDIVMNFKYFND